MLGTAVLLVSLALGTPLARESGEYFRIEVIDAATGRGVPLVELRTTHDVRYYTDSNGLVAFREPGLMDQRVFFHVASHGYRFAKDGFGFSGARLDVTPGGRATLKLERVNIAERLYRVTGAGIYRDTLLLDEPAPIQEPLLNGQVVGMDSVQTALYRGKIHWFWGDTARPSYPLGNFFMTGATSELPGNGGLDPAVGVDLSIFVGADGFARKMAPMPDPKPCWCDAFVTLKDAAGHERLFAAYARIDADMSAYERGLVEFDDTEQQFRKVLEFDLQAPVIPGGHPFRHTVDGVEYIYFDVALPLVRVRAEAAAFCDLSSYEAFTPLAAGRQESNPTVERDAAGQVRLGWKRDAPPLRPQDRADLVRSGALLPDESLIHLQDAATGAPIIPHNGSVYWNEYRRRWITIRCQSWGSSMLGETWYAEADTPLGPWVYARKIVSHDRYSFYNPKHHPLFDQQGGQIIYFEGTYANTFSGNPEKTPRYDYNQMMYRLDLADERLVLPVPVYVVADGADEESRLATWHRLPAQDEPRAIAFFALERPRADAVPVFETRRGGAWALCVGPPETAGEPLFFALPADLADPPATTVPLHELTHDDGIRRAYAAGGDVDLAGFRAAPQPLCRVWRNPGRWPFPIDRR